MKNTKLALATWSMDRFGDIIREKIVRLKEDLKNNLQQQIR